MLVCMRTTLNLPDALAQEAKARAEADGRTLTSLVEEGLRAVLTAKRSRRRVELPTSGRPGDRPLVDLTDRDAVGEVLDAEGWK